MKKVIMIMSLMILLIVTGCSKNEKIEEKEEILKSVYCDSCAEESNEVTKFCSSCGKEAKWLAEKPELAEKTKGENTEVIDKNKDKAVEVANEKETKNVEEQCTHCWKYFNSNKLSRFLGEALCEDCNNLPKICENGFDRICEGCNECMSGYEFTYELAIELAEEYYNIKDHPNDFITADPEPRYDSIGKYYKLFVKSKEMLEQGTNGILFSVLVYENGSIVEDF